MLSGRIVEAMAKGTPCGAFIPSYEAYVVLIGQPANMPAFDPVTLWTTNPGRHIVSCYPNFPAHTPHLRIYAPWPETYAA